MGVKLPEDEAIELSVPAKILPGWAKPLSSSFRIESDIRFATKSIRSRLSVWGLQAVKARINKMGIIFIDFIINFLLQKW